MEVHTLILTLLMGRTISIEFDAYNCDRPTEIQYLSHDDCIHSNKPTYTREFSVMQKHDIFNVEAFECFMYLTSSISFCGAFSHNKETGHSTFNIPQQVTGETCRTMAKERVFIGDKMSFPIALNQVNPINMVSHGAVSIDDSNVSCQGSWLTLSNGQTNKNMLKSLHFNVWVHEVNLTVVKHTVIHPQTQTIIGLEDEGYGTYRESTFIWDKIDDTACDLMKAVTAEFGTEDNKNFASERYKIRFTTGDSFYHEKCRIMITTTQYKGIYLAEKSADASEVTNVDSANLNINAHYSSQLAFLNSKLRRLLQNAYIENSSINCQTINTMEKSTTKRTKGNTFIRNLGDCSITFKCEKITVAPLTVEKCYQRLPVQDIKGRTFYLDSETRILMDHSAPEECQLSFLPAYRTITNEIMMFSPEPKKIHIIPLENKSKNETGDQGIYPEEMIDNWLSAAYIQHYATNAYKYMINQICTTCNKGMMPASSLQFFQEQMSKLSKFSLMGMLDFNIQYYGGICSIIVLSITALKLLYGIISFMIKLCLIQKDAKGLMTAIFRAAFAEIFLVTAVTKEEMKQIP